jgi:hypothetical protein
MVTYLNVVEIICFEFETWKFGLEIGTKRTLRKRGVGRQFFTFWCCY